MTDIQIEFLRLAVIEKLQYEKIAIELGIDRKVFSHWWNELKTERERLTLIRDRWQSKCSELKFDLFRKWYEATPKECYYCKITENEISKLWERYPKLTKRSRGKKLEIERLEPNEPYINTKNLVFSCYWCNNAKTDTFTKDEFLKVSKVIEQIWKERLK